MPGIALTIVGRELLQVVNLAEADEFNRDLASYFETKSLTMEEVPEPSWRVTHGASNA